jgi:cytosolic phospholipase A2
MGFLNSNVRSTAGVLLSKGKNTKLGVPSKWGLRQWQCLGRCPARIYAAEFRQGFFTSRQERLRRRREEQKLKSIPITILTTALVIWWLYPSEEFRQLSHAARAARRRSRAGDSDSRGAEDDQDQSAWFQFATRFEALSNITDIEWTAWSDKIVGFILPEWGQLIPGYLRKLQRELSMSPGSLADEIWHEAHDPLLHPEIRYSAKVRVSNDICDEEKEFLARRRKIACVALAKYLGIREKDVHPDDVPTIAMCGSGGGLRALVAGTGSLIATEEDGLFDCITYTSGVSGSCWLQALYNSSITGNKFYRVLDHLKARAGVHIAYPPTALQLLIAAPTNKYLLSGFVEKLRGDPKASFGLVDVYGLLLAARFLVPKGELAVNPKDFKLSHQREYIKCGQNPMPIYTAVRHEIPDMTPGSPKEVGSVSEAAKEEAKREAWFQWFEITPYEFFCEEFSAGIPTWSLGRRFKGGEDQSLEVGFHLPEIRMPLLLGIFGSAFCATLSHYYREVQPVVQSMTGLSAIDQLISGRNEDLSKVHPIDPATVPNFAFGMEGMLPKTTPPSIYKSQYLQLMDAGMSNNLPIYPLLRPGRNVEILIAFDASADIKTDNWLSVADGYARQREIKGWPVGIGWPKAEESSAQARDDLEKAQANSTQEAEKKLTDAKADQAIRLLENAASSGKDGDNKPGASKFDPGDENAGDLGYCTVWVGTTQERTTDPPPPPKAIDDASTWQLMEPNAGIAVVYLPYLANPKVEGVSPGTTDYLSTWNFIYTPKQIDSVVALARANYNEGKDQIRACVRAVYERKKLQRERSEERAASDHYRRLVRRGTAHRLGEGDHFS